MVCLGSPKQELWMAEHAGKISCGLMAGLGGSLDVLAGNVQRAPETWRRLGLEWLYRVIKEPKRIKRVAKLPLFVLEAARRGGDDMGRLIVLEGIDGSGKSAQYRRLCARFDRERLGYHSIVFPRYDQESSALIRMYLNGDFGGKPEDVNPCAASIFYAVDRYASYMTDWREYYQNGGVVLSDRYTTSNAVHQGAKLPAAEQPAFFDWLYDLEYVEARLPRPDLVIFLDVDLATSERRMAHRREKYGTGGGHTRERRRIPPALPGHRPAAPPRTTAGASWTS